MEVVIIGAGGHAQDIASWTRLPTVDHHLTASWLAPQAMVIGVNDPRTRVNIESLLTSLGWVGAGPLIHPSSYIGDAKIADGAVISPLCSLTTGVTVGHHTHVGAGSHLTRCTIGDFTTIAPGVTVCGDVSIGDRCLIGAGATVRNLVTIGDDVTVGAGAVVVCDVPDGATVKGVPAR